MSDCDPTVQLCDTGIHNDTLPANGTNSTTSLVGKLGDIASGPGLLGVGALQLSAGLVTYFGSLSDAPSKTKKPASYMFYQSIINSVFGTAGIAVGVMGLLGGKGPKEEAPTDMPPEEDPAEEEEPMLMQSEDGAPPGDEPPAEEPPKEEKKPGMPLGELVSILGLASGASTLLLYFMTVGDTDNAYEDSEKYLNLAASSTAILFGTISLLASLGGKPDAPEEADAPEDIAPEDMIPELM